MYWSGAQSTGAEMRKYFTVACRQHKAHRHHAMPLPALRAGRCDGHRNPQGAFISFTDG